MSLPTSTSFSGIGGFALAAKWNGYRTLAFCDNEPYAQAVLKKHWPDVPCHQDIREVRGELYAGVTLLTGGFPCQPFSDVGRKRGQADDRYLWPEMFRVICEARPTWVLGENVAGIKNMALDQALSDLEGKDYQVQSFVIPACAVNAPHRRDRSGSVRWMWPSPRACELEGGVVKAENDGNGWYRKNKKGVRWGVKLKDAVAALENGQKNLNPQFVEYLMGYPIGWTDATLSEMPSSRKSRQKSSDASTK
jgi:site-specific DNA-cytosine methylase